ncbi:tol-pal system protein YbgF [bacterium]|nr:tol-pal system protein YbgF [bacterium]
MNRSFFIVALIALSLLTSNLFAVSIQTRLDKLEERVDTVEKTNLGNNAEVAQSLTRVEQLREEFQGIKGSIEANSHIIKSQSGDTQRYYKDLEFRIQAIEDKMELFQTLIMKAVASISPKTADEGKLYQKGLDQIAEGNYLAAIGTFKSFNKNYSKSTLTDNAQFWIGDCYFAMRDFQKAIKEHQELISKYPKSKKASEAALKQGYSFYELAMYDEAKVFLNKVVADYPNTESAANAKEKLNLIKSKESEKPEEVTPVTPVAPSAPAEGESTLTY